MDRDRLHSIERWTQLLGAVLTLGAFLLGGLGWGLAVSLGAGIMILNTLATRFASELLRRGQEQGGRVQPVQAVMLFNLKMAGVLVALYLVINYLKVEPVGLVIGLSVYPLGAVCSALFDDQGSALAGPPSLEDQHG